MKEFKFKNKGEAILFCDSLFKYAKDNEEAIKPAFVNFLQRVYEFRFSYADSFETEKYERIGKQQVIDKLRKKCSTQ